MDDKVPFHRACTIECPLYHNGIHVQKVQWSVQSPWPQLIRKYVVCHPQGDYNKTELTLNVNLSSVCSATGPTLELPHHVFVISMTRCPSGSGISWTTMYIPSCMKQTLTTRLSSQHNVYETYFNSLSHMFDLLVAFSRVRVCMCISIYVHEGIKRINFCQASVHEISCAVIIFPQETEGNIFYWFIFIIIYFEDDNKGVYTPCKLVIPL